MIKFSFDDSHLGRHWLIECYGCPKKLLEKVESIERIMKGAVEVSGATMLNTSFHQFSPYGVSGFVVIAESHFSIHTWPENGYAAIDIFTCGATIDVEKATAYLEEQLKCEQLEIQYMKRGNVQVANRLNHIVPNKL